MQSPLLAQPPIEHSQAQLEDLADRLIEGARLRPDDWPILVVDPSCSMVQLRQRRDDLQALLHKIYRSAPHTDGKAYGQAQDALKNREDLTFSDDEIDAFLPGPLKRKASAT